MVRVRDRVRALMRSRAVLVVGVAVSVAVPAVTLPRLPAVTLWPLLLGPAAVGGRQVRALSAALAGAD